MLPFAFVGAVLQLELDIRGASAFAGRAINGTISLQPFFLESYSAQMGIANLTCGGGCGCAATLLHARNTLSHRSIQTSREIALIMSSKSTAQCGLRLEVVDQRVASGGHRFKLMRLIVEAVAPTA